MLNSRIFKGDPALEACLISDRAHVASGARGDHVAKIQAVVMFLDNIEISENELRAKLYGPSTSAAVLNYKRKRQIINFSYQNQVDNIVGKMTIQALDDELESQQKLTGKRSPLPCRINTPPDPVRDRIVSFLAARRSAVA